MIFLKNGMRRMGAPFAIAAAIGLAACSGGKPGADSEQPKSGAVAENSEGAPGKPHGPHSPPHKGLMIELGAHVAHAEAVFEAGEGRLTVYFLDSSASGAARSSSADLQARITLKKGAEERVFQAALTGVESTLTGERAGDTSQFTSTDPAWSGLELAKVELAEAVVGGITYRDLVISPETADVD